MEIDIVGIRMEVYPIYMGLKGEEGQFYLGKWWEDTFLYENLKGALLVVKWRKDEKKDRSRQGSLMRKTPDAETAECVLEGM